MAAVQAPARVDIHDPRSTWRPGPGGAGARLLVFGLIMALAVAAPLLVPDVQTNLITKAYVFGIIALSMNVLLGYVGTVSLGHQAFVGVGAFSAGYVLTEMGLPWFAAVLVAIAIGAAQALLIGVLALRVQGFFFAIVTLAYGLFAREVIFNITAFTGGGAGQRAARPGFVAPPEGYTGPITADVRYAWLVLAFLILVWLFDWRLTSSRGGRAIEALRDDARVAASWGINIRAYTLLAFGISGAMAGLAGALFASTDTIVSPESFTLSTALIYVLMTTVGGIGSRPGVVMGGFVFAGIAPVLTALHDTPGWGVGEAGFGDEAAVAVCSSSGARTVAVLLALMLVGVGAEAARHLVLGAKRPGWQRVIGGVVALVALYLAAVVGLGAFNAISDYCVFASITPLLEPVIGVVLLIVTLIQFPGGIAEQMEAPLRWLSFGKLHGEESQMVDGATSGSQGGH